MLEKLFRGGESEVGRAEAVTQKLAGLSEKILAGQLELQTHLLERERRDNELHNLKVKVELGEQVSPKALAEAQRGIDSVQAQIDETAGKIRILRGAVTSLAAELPAHHAAVTKLLPAHNQQIIEAFAAEWDAA